MPSGHDRAFVLLMFLSACMDQPRFEHESEIGGQLLQHEQSGADKEFILI